MTRGSRWITWDILLLLASQANNRPPPEHPSTHPLTQPQTYTWHDSHRFLCELKQKVLEIAFCCSTRGARLDRQRRKYWCKLASQGASRWMMAPWVVRHEPLCWWTRWWWWALWMWITFLPFLLLLFLKHRKTKAKQKAVLGKHHIHVAKRDKRWGGGGGVQHYNNK